MTLADLKLASHYYEERMVDEWRRTRAVMFTMAKIWSDPKKGQLTTPEAFLPLPGDKDAGPEAMSDDEIKGAFEALRNQGWKV